MRVCPPAGGQAAMAWEAGALTLFWLECAGAVAIALLTFAAAYVLFKPADLGDRPFHVRMGALIQGATFGAILAFLIIPVRLQLMNAEPGSPFSLAAALALLPALMAIIMVRRGALSFVPGVRHPTRAFRRALLRRQIRTAQEGLARLEALDAAPDR